MNETAGNTGISSDAPLPVPARPTAAAVATAVGALGQLALRVAQRVASVVESQRGITCLE